MRINYNYFLIKYITFDPFAMSIVYRVLYLNKIEISPLRINLIHMDWLKHWEYTQRKNLNVCNYEKQKI